MSCLQGEGQKKAKELEHLSNDKPCYFNRPLGKNMLGEFLNKASELLNNNSTTSRSKVANHSARKTCLNTLLSNYVNGLHVSQLSGHKNLDSLNIYHTASAAQQKRMSNLLYNNSSLSSNTVVPNFENKTPQDQYLGSAFHGSNISNCVFNIFFFYRKNKCTKLDKNTIQRLYTLPLFK